MDMPLVGRAREGTVLVLEMQDSAVRNALSRVMLAELIDAISRPADDVLGIVLTGGVTCFSAGGDFREIKGTSEDLAYDDAVAAVVTSILESDRIVVAAIEGPCIGAAADIALACDYRIAGMGSFIQIPATKLGLLYNPATIDRLQRTYPRDTVRRLLLMGERFEDHEARCAGLFSCVVSQGTSMEAAIADLSRADPGQARAVRATKRLLSELEVGTANSAEWQGRRIDLLDSEARQRAVRETLEARRRVKGNLVSHRPVRS